MSTTDLIGFIVGFIFGGGAFVLIAGGWIAASTIRDVIRFRRKGQARTHQRKSAA